MAPRREERQRAGEQDLEQNYVTDEIKSLIGKRSERYPATDDVVPSEVRRFFQATMDDNPYFWNAEAAAKSRYGEPIAPLGYPVHAFRREPGTPDPLTDADNPNFDGERRSFRPGLPPVEISLSGVLNGGYEYEFFRYARHGDKIFRISSYHDIYQRPGKNGPMVFVILEDLFVDENERPYLRALNTSILR